MAETRMLERGGAVPHIEVRTIDGQAFDYATIWQRKNLVLVVVPASSTDAHATELSARASELHSRQTALVVTRDSVSGLPPPGLLIADRWGEIVHVAAGSDTRSLPGADDLLEWVDYLERRCPECEGESK